MYAISGRVRYSEINQKKELDLFSIVNYFQDCSTFQSEDSGVGLEYLGNNQRAWLLNSWQLLIRRSPVLAEHITISTWPYRFQGMYGYRNFIMKDKENAVCAYANSIWVYVDTQTGRPVRCTDEVMNSYTLEPAYDMEYAPRKIALPGLLTAEKPFTVISSDIDTNNHVNNGQYIRMAEEFLPDGYVVRQMRAEYRSPAVLGDIIHPKVYLDTADSLCTVILSNEHDKPYAIVEFAQTCAEGTSI